MSRILLCVSGGIAAYKSIAVMRLLQKDGHDVRVVLTPNACRFVSRLSFQSLTGEPVMVDEFPPETDLSSSADAITHIEAAKWADLIVVAPATANTIAKMAAGIADNLLTSLLLAATCKVLVFPAMNTNMYHHPATQANLDTLSKRGADVATAATGVLACGDTADGRMPEPEEIAAYVRCCFHQPYKGIKVLVSAGPTVEGIDPVRYISNHSSGKMGLAIVSALKAQGADVTLVCGPIALPNTDFADKTIHIKSAAEMLGALQAEIANCDMLIMAAAVADYTPELVHEQKIKKTGDTLELRLVKTPDILKELAKGKCAAQLFVGFAAESEKLIEHATAKLHEKKLDMIVANDISRSDIGFGANDNEVTLLYGHESQTIAKSSKAAIAKAVIDKALELYKAKY
jgi:phosphopantothenoylcysteine decarboxylase/phosphopantothenate--cysteine ligase